MVICLLDCAITAYIEATTNAAAPTEEAGTPKEGGEPSESRPITEKDAFSSTGTPYRWPQ
jgi:hypothetical protein